MPRLKHAAVAKDAPAAKPTIVWGLKLQFFVAEGGETMGTIDIKDNRLDRVLYEALNASPAFIWDEERNGYLVRLDNAPKASAPPPETAPTVETKPPVMSHRNLLANPRWRGTKTGYTSREGWVLDYFEDRGEERLPRGERGKHWQLTHCDATGEIWYRNKKLATAAILSGDAKEHFFGPDNSK